MDWKPFENKHQGERCFILGNAPSLSDENLSLLKNEKVFICNRGHKAKDIGLDHFDYHVVLDLLFYEDYAKELYEVSEGIKFYPEIVKEYNFYRGEEFVPIYSLPTHRQTGAQKIQLLNPNTFPVSYTDGWGKTGNTVLTSSLIAYFMGFKEIYILGTEWIYRKNSTHFYNDTSKRENNVPDGHMTKGFKYLPAFVSFFKKNNIKFVNLSKKFEYKHMMSIDSLEQILK
jgi:hypothetical protein|tara:strand:+ start:2501 stop:3187 length:687 start_codon:yes stop_codon:yes gene_type:complete